MLQSCVRTNLGCPAWIGTHPECLFDDRQLNRIEVVRNEIPVHAGSNESLVGRIEGPYDGHLATNSGQRKACQRGEKHKYPGASIAKDLSGTS